MEYLNGRKKEVIDTMVFLFDQDYATEAYAEEKARRRGIKTPLKFIRKWDHQLRKLFKGSR